MLFAAACVVDPDQVRFAAMGLSLAIMLAVAALLIADHARPR